MGTTWLSVDNGWLTVHGIAHLTWHTDLLDHSLIHRLGLVWIRWHSHLLRVHELLLVLGFVLIHALAGAGAAHLFARSVGVGWSELVHAMSVCAVV